MCVSSWNEVVCAWSTYSVWEEVSGCNKQNGPRASSRFQQLCMCSQPTAVLIRPDYGALCKGKLISILGGRLFMMRGCCSFPGRSHAPHRLASLLALTTVQPLSVTPVPVQQHTYTYIHIACTSSCICFISQYFNPACCRPTANY